MVATLCPTYQVTAPEMLRIGQMMRAGGSWVGRQLVPAAFVRVSMI